MSPLVAAPNRGYADWQRIDNYDTGVLIALAPGSTNATIRSAIEDVSRYETICGQIQLTAGVCELVFLWFADPAGTILLGERVMYLTSSIPDPMQIHIDNLGPFVQVITIALGGGNYTQTTTLIASNRSIPIEVVPENTVIVDAQNIPNAAGNTFIQYPLDYWAGPMRIFCIQSQAGACAVQVLNAGGAWDNLDQILLAALTPTATNTIAPLGAWRLSIINTSGANGSFFLSCIPSYSGAS